MVNLSLKTGRFSDQVKTAIVNPLLKKQELAPIFQNLRPISNLLFISKLKERAVANQIEEHLTYTKVYHLLQSAYRKIIAQKQLF